MLINLFLNACILITFISLSYILYKEKNVKASTSLPIRFSIGLISGLLGVILIHYSGIVIDDKIIIDLRYIPILLTVIYCGFLPAMISAVIIGIFRLVFYGISDASILGFIVSIIGGLGFSFICNRTKSIKKKWLYSMLYLMLIFTISICILVDNPYLLLKIIASYYFANVCVSFIVYIYAEYLSDSIRITNKLKDEATKDFLTGLNNARQFDLSFHNITQIALRKEENLSLLYIDIDFFKRINDAHGHNTGDVVLKKLADILVDTVRVFDVVSRNGGEEFSILLLDCSADHAMRIAERLRKKVEAYDFIISDSLILKTTISVGISSYPFTTENIKTLLKDADEALYEAKRTGRNKIVLYQ